MPETPPPKIRVSPPPTVRADAGGYKIFEARK